MVHGDPDCILGWPTVKLGEEYDTPGPLIIDPDVQLSKAGIDNTIEFPGPTEAVEVGCHDSDHKCDEERDEKERGEGTWRHGAVKNSP